MTLATHPRFPGYLPPLPERFTDVRLVSVKVEPAPAPLPPAAFFDVVLADGDGLYVVPFVERRNGVTIVPEAYASHEALFTAIEPQLRALDQRFEQSRQASLELFANDADVAAWAPVQSTDGTIVPGLAAYGILFDLLDRYRFAATLCHGRSVLDLRAGSGYGAVVLGGRPSRYAASPDDEASQRALARFRFAPQQAPPDADVVLAFAVAPDRVDAFVDEARSRLRNDGIAIITSLGEAGRDALTACGLDARPMTRPGLDPLAMRDVVAIVEPKRVFASAPVETPARVTPRPLSVLFVLRPSGNRAFGGDVVQVRETVNALRARGHRVELSLDEAPVVPEGIDIVHISNLTSPDETLPQAKAVSRAGVPVVMMPIFIDHADETVWGMQAAFDALRYAATVDEVRINQSAVAERRMTIGRHDGQQLQPPPARTDLGQGYTAKQKEILRYVDFLIANAYSEIYCIQRHLATTIPFSIAPSCCNPALYFPERAGEFEKRYNLRDFILSTGRIEARKQQLTLMMLARRWPDRPVVLIGRNADVGYGAMLRLCWTENVVVIPHMAEEELAGAYAAARVVAMPSWDEVVSLSSVNAAACAASLVLTRNGFEHEYMRDDALYCDPGDVENIANAIDRAWRTHDERREQRMALSERVRREYTWARSAEATEEAYYRFLATFTPREPGRDRV